MREIIGSVTCIYMDAVKGMRYWSSNESTIGIQDVNNGQIQLAE